MKNYKIVSDDTVEELENSVIHLTVKEGWCPCGGLVYEYRNEFQGYDSGGDKIFNKVSKFHQALEKDIN